MVVHPLTEDIPQPVSVNNQLIEIIYGLACVWLSTSCALVHGLLGNFQRMLPLSPSHPCIFNCSSNDVEMLYIIHFT